VSSIISSVSPFVSRAIKDHPPSLVPTMSLTPAGLEIEEHQSSPLQMSEDLPTTPAPIDETGNKYSTPLAIQFENIISVWDGIFASLRDNKIKSNAKDNTIHVSNIPNEIRRRATVKSVHF
jgi:hypothetical protein